MAKPIVLSLATMIALATSAPAMAQRVLSLDGQSLAIDASHIGGAARMAGPPNAGRPGGAPKALSRAEVRKLADAFGLLKETRTNPQLGFLDGDIAYWFEQHLSEDRLKLEFAARRAVLDAAEQQKIVIADQGKLSWAAQQVAADLQKARLGLPAK